MKTYRNIEVVTERGWLTIYSGPPASGKSIEARRQAAEGDRPFLNVHEGMYGGKESVAKIQTTLNGGMDVIYETTKAVKDIPQELLDIANTIEIFRRE